MANYDVTRRYREPKFVKLGVESRKIKLIGHPQLITVFLTFLLSKMVFI